MSCQLEAKAQGWFFAVEHAVVSLLWCWDFCCFFPQCCAVPPNLAFSQELNKRLTVHVSSFLNHLCSLMCPLLAGQPGATTAFSCHCSPSGLRLHVKSELSGLPFYWDFHCCPAPLDMVSKAAGSSGRGVAKIKDYLLRIISLGLSLEAVE